MNLREKILAAAAGLVVLVFILYVAISKLVVAPLALMDSEASKLLVQINDLSERNKAKAVYLKRMEELARQSFGTDESKVGEELLSRLVMLLDRSGLSTEKRAMQPVTGPTVAGAYKEIGRTVHARGKLNEAVDFLYLLNADPHLHRLDNLSVTPEAGGNVELQLKYCTLVLSRAPGEPTPSTEPAQTQPAVNLHDEDRAQYDVIASRDLFRPYIQRQVVPPAPEVSQPVAQEPPRPPPAQGQDTSPDRFRVVGLPTWAGQTDIFVRDTQAGQTQAYKLGEALVGGRIVMVDYRPMPLAEKPDLLSPSRVIIQIGPDYWAVELGQSLSMRYRMNAQKLPETLRLVPASAPATQENRIGTAAANKDAKGDESR